LEAPLSPSLAWHPCFTFGKKLDCASAFHRRRPNRWRAGATIRNHTHQQILSAAVNGIEAFPVELEVNRLGGHDGRDY
jgi:hypothetical protein